MFSVLSLSFVTDSIPGLPDEKVKGNFADKNYKRYSDCIAQVGEPELPSKTCYFPKQPLASFSTVAVEDTKMTSGICTVEINPKYLVIDRHF